MLSFHVVVVVFTAVWSFPLLFSATLSPNASMLYNFDTIQSILMKIGTHFPKLPIFALNQIDMPAKERTSHWRRHTHTHIYTNRRETSGTPAKQTLFSECKIKIYCVDELEMRARWSWEAGGWMWTDRSANALTWHKIPLTNPIETCQMHCSFRKFRSVLLSYAHRVFNQLFIFVSSGCAFAPTTIMLMHCVQWGKLERMR